MRAKSGEILTVVLIGLALGSVISVVRYNQWAQQTANLRGVEIGAGDYVAERPLEAIGYPILGAAAGWGVGELLDSGDDDDAAPRVPNVTVQSGRDSTVVIAGRDGTASNDQSQPTTTSTTTPAAGGVP